MKKKILVVDNHPVILEFMSRLLTKEGHQVMTAEDGLAALDILKTYTADIIFIDLIMPNIGGQKLCQMVRNLPHLKDAYIVILSAVAAEEEIKHGDYGADACVAKGPLNKLGPMVLDVIAQAGEKGGGSESGRIIGREAVYARQITKELLSIKKHFEIVLDSLSEGILEITPGGRIVYANPQATSIFGVREDRLLAANLEDMVDENDRKRIRNMLREVNATCRPMIEHRPVALHEKQVLFKILPVKGAGKKSLIVVMDDISERKKIEQQLQHAQKMEAIGTLAGGIAHDFNNLLMVVQGNISLMMLDMEHSHPFFERLKNMEKQVHSGSRLTGQLLGYARKGRYEVRPTSLNQIIGEASEAFSRTRKDIVTSHELSEDLYPTEVDAGQIEQVLMNLFVNAADAMPDGGDLFIRTANVTHEAMKGKLYRPKPGEYVMLTIRDTGTGMDENTLRRIFEPFFTTKEMGRGTGLGLASVYGIIKGHGGFIDVSSEKGKGTTFAIYLPASKKAITETCEMTESLKKGEETALLVDDEETMLEIGQELLKSLGYRVYGTSSGQEALQIYKEKMNEIGIVLLDMVMPKMSGGEVFDKLKKMNPDVKVLLLSGYSIDGEATRILDRGCSGFIQKPFKMNQLSSVLDTILRGEIRK